MQTRIGILCLLALCGCGEKKIESPRPKIIARVNGEEITEFHFKQALRNIETSSATGSFQNQVVLKTLIDQKLLAQEAVKHKLDKMPKVLAALDVATQQILAQAWLDWTLKGEAVSKPDRGEMEQYYQDHPELFANRKIYHYQYVALPGSAVKLKTVKERLDQAKDLEMLVEWLRANNIQHAAGKEIRGALKIPLHLLPAMSKMKTGDIRALDGKNDQVFVIKLIDAKPESISKEIALPVIEQFLVKQNEDKLLGKKFEKIRAAASIEYVGEYPISGEMSDTASKTAEHPPQEDQRN